MSAMSAMVKDKAVDTKNMIEIVELPNYAPGESKIAYTPTQDPWR